MDAIVVLIILAISLFINGVPEANEEEQIVNQVATLNPAVNTDFRHDENAFMTIANELGFH